MHLQEGPRDCVFHVQSKGSKKRIKRDHRKTQGMTRRQEVREETTSLKTKTMRWFEEEEKIMMMMFPSSHSLRDWFMPDSDLFLVLWRWCLLRFLLLLSRSSLSYSPSPPTTQLNIDRSCALIVPRTQSPNVHRNRSVYPVEQDHRTRHTRHAKQVNSSSRHLLSSNPIIVKQTIWEMFFTTNPFMVNLFATNQRQKSHMLFILTTGADLYIISSFDSTCTCKCLSLIPSSSMYVGNRGITLQKEWKLLHTFRWFFESLNYI